jgi:hypothetical protein
MTRERFTSTPDMLQPNHGGHDCYSPTVHLPPSIIESMCCAGHVIRLAVERRSGQYLGGYSERHKLSPGTYLLNHTHGFPIRQVI